jgi:hypothetical protein
VIDIMGPSVVSIPSRGSQVAVRGMPLYRTLEEQAIRATYYFTFGFQTLDDYIYGDDACQTTVSVGSRNDQSVLEAVVNEPDYRRQRG